MQEGERKSDIAPTGVRLPPELRDALLREATINSRSLSQEITARLAESFRAARPVGVSSSPPPVYDQSKGSGAMLTDASRHLQAAGINEHERLLLSLFKGMTVERQLALLTVLKR